MSLAEQLKKERELKLQSQEKEKKKKEEEERERTETEGLKVIMESVVEAAKENVTRGFIDIKQICFGWHDYNNPCDGPRCKNGSDMCFSVCSLRHFDPQKLKGLARKLYFALIGEPYCFTVKVIDISTENTDCAYFQARWDSEVPGVERKPNE